LFVAYNDGPTRGALQCRLTSDTYRFELLARDSNGTYDSAAWDRGQEIRIFDLTPLPLKQFKQLNRLLSMKAAYSRMAEDKAFYHRVHALLATADPPLFAIATHGIGTKIIGVRNLLPNDVGTVVDWFSFLNLAKDTSGNIR